MKRILSILAGLLLASTAFAVQITVPSAPGAGYGLISLPSGNYVASSTIFGGGISAVGGLNAIQVDDGSGALNGDNTSGSFNPSTGNQVISGGMYAGTGAFAALNPDGVAGGFLTQSTYSGSKGLTAAPLFIGYNGSSNPTYPLGINFAVYVDYQSSGIQSTTFGSGINPLTLQAEGGNVLIASPQDDSSGLKLQVAGGMESTSEWIGDSAWSTIGANYPIANGIIYDQDQGGNNIVTPMFVGANFGSYVSNPLGVLFRNDTINNTSGFSATDIGASGANFALQPEGGPVFIGTYADDGSGSILQMHGKSHFQGGATYFGSGPFLNLGSDAYMLATGATGENTGFTALSSDNSGYVSFDWLIDPSASGGFSMTIPTGSQDMFTDDRISGEHMIDYIHNGSIEFMDNHASIAQDGTANFKTADYDGTNLTPTWSVSSEGGTGSSEGDAVFIPLNSGSGGNFNFLGVYDSGSGNYYGITPNAAPGSATGHPNVISLGGYYNGEAIGGKGGSSGTPIWAVFDGSANPVNWSDDSGNFSVTGSITPGGEINYPATYTGQSAGIPIYSGITTLADSSHNLYVPAGLYDGSASLGTSGYVLSSTGSGTAWVPASGGGGGTWYQDETPSGTVNGTNHVFSLAHSPTAIVFVYVNGKYEVSGGVDYTRSGTTITFATSSVPHTGDIISANYQ